MARRNTTARQKAAAHAAAFTQREEKLQELAADFFDLEDKSEHGKLQKRIQDYQQKLEELQANSAAAEAELRAQHLCDETGRGDPGQYRCPPRRKRPGSKASTL